MEWSRKNSLGDKGSGDKNRKKLIMDIASELRTAVTISKDLKTTQTNKERAFMEGTP